MSIESIPNSVRKLYEVHEWKHASAILKTDYPNELSDITEVLVAFRLLKSEILAPGGGKSIIAQNLDQAFRSKMNSM